MLRGSVNVVNHLGLHARAAAQLVRLAARFKSSIVIRREDSGGFANAKSILSVLALAAPYGAVLEIEVDGDDENEALDAITSMFGSGFGEI